jgi:hypothetical protein
MKCRTRIILLFISVITASSSFILFLSPILSRVGSHPLKQIKAVQERIRERDLTIAPHHSPRRI